MILKKTIYINTIIQIILIKIFIQIDKHKAKYIITARISIIIMDIYSFSLLYIRMNGKSINFDNKNIKKSDFYNKNKKIFNVDGIDVNKIVSKKEQYDKYSSSKYFVGYNDNNVIRPLYSFISQTTGYINKFEKNKIKMFLMFKDKQLLENYNKIWKKLMRINEYRF